MFKRSERRTRRSDNPYQALCLQLEQTKRDARLDAVVLAMHNGLVVAAAGEPGVCEELGAVAPLMGRTVFDPLASSELCADDLEVRTMACGGERFFLASLGGSKKRDALLRRSVNGVQRILTRH